MAEFGDTEPVTVEWRRRTTDEIAPPVIATLPYLELKLEHPDTEATGWRERFFPDAVPYELGGEQRVFYWRPGLETATCADPSDWVLACATTHGLAGIGALPSTVPPLKSEGRVAEEKEEGEGEEEREGKEEGEGGVHHAVVGGTVAGDATTVGLVSYEPPEIRIERRSNDALSLTVDGRPITLEAGTRRSIDLEPRRVTLADDGQTTVVRPELSARFPGERTLLHTAPDADYRLFPSFGLDFAAVDSPLSVPTTVGELDHEALADRLGVDLSARPYPERVLWQAFAHAAFDLHARGSAAIGQLDSGFLVVEPAAASYADRTASSSSS